MLPPENPELLELKAASETWLEGRSSAFKERGEEIRFMSPDFLSLEISPDKNCTPVMLKHILCHPGIASIF